MTIKRSDALDNIIGLSLIAGVVALYFLPTIIAVCRDHINTVAIFITNFFFGWSVLGWIISLIWSVLN